MSETVSPALAAAADAVPFFDGHNDTLLRLVQGRHGPERFLEGMGGGHVDLPRARAGGFAGGLFACFAPAARQETPLPSGDGGAYAVPTAPTPGLAEAQRITLAMFAALRRIERLGGGAVAVCTDVEAIRGCIAAGSLAAVLHIEGAEAIDGDLDALEVLHAAGLRSLGPVWSRPNIFAHGVPFRFPASPDIGPGLTDAGRALVRACNELGVLVDLSHMNEAGFWDVAKLTTAPLVASHSNAHALCPASRNLTDRQLDAIRDSGGLAGLNFAVGFLRRDGANEAATPLDTVVEMIDYMVERLGVDGVALGSDFDGCTVPRAIGDAAGLQALVAALRARGYDESSLRKIGHENWLRVLGQTWRA